MKSGENYVVTTRIDEGIERVISRINRNAIIYSCALVLILFAFVMVSIRQSRSNQQLATMSGENYKELLKMQESQDADREAIGDYVKNMMLTMNKLQKDNPNIKTPKAPELRPSNFPPVTEKELERSPVPVLSPSPTPTPKVKVVRKYIRVKPKSFWDYFTTKPRPKDRKRSYRR
jgi:hypothetical protein